MPSVARSDRILAQVGARAGMTRCGTEWLKEALDPFHDTALDPTGYPDTTTSASVIQPVKQSYQLSAPSTITTSQTWDCNVVMMPWLNPITILPTASGPNNKLSQINQTVVASTPVVGGIQFMAAASNVPLNIGSLANNGTTTINQNFCLPSTYLNGNSRVVAMAMEICNTTSDLNRQGLITVYRVPVPQNDDGTAFNIKQFHTADTSSITGAASGIFMPAPPNSIANAQLFAGTKAWKAADGSYNVGMFNTPDVPAQGLSFTQPIMYTTSQTDATVFTSAYSADVVNIVANVGLATAPSVYWTEMDMSGSYFTGLSSSTTLTVNYIVYIERFPTQDDLDLIVSAKKSPEYDIKALEAYSIISQSMPVAVPFDENWLGEWFTNAVKDVVNVASDWAQPALSLIPHPYAQAASKFIGGAKTVVDYFDQPASDTSAPQAPPLEVEKYLVQQRKPAKNVNNRQLQDAKRGLKKTVKAEVRKDVLQAVKSARGRPKRR